MSGLNCRFSVKAFIFCAIICGFSIFSGGCSGTGQTNDLHSNVAERSVVTYATRLSIIPQEGYSQIKISDPWQGAKGVIQNWYLANDTTNIPSSINPDYVIRVPVRRIICTSTTHLAMIEAIGEAGSVKGFSGTHFLYSAEYNRMAEMKTLHDIGYDDNLNKELILKLEPDLIMVYGVGGESAAFIEKLREMGLKVMINADYLETDPLGKAEWIKLFGVLYSKEFLADSIFRIAEEGYNTVKATVSERTIERPGVLLGFPYRDTWYISPGNSYISGLIRDAGGYYLWSETTSYMSLPLSLENVYIKALQADFWLNPGSANSLAEMRALDERFSGLSCFGKGKVFNNTGRSNSHGGNDYWESGSLSPHIILKDIASILHPGIFSDDKLVFFKKLE